MGTFVLLIFLHRGNAGAEACAECGAFDRGFAISTCHGTDRPTRKTPNGSSLLLVRGTRRNQNGKRRSEKEYCFHTRSMTHHRCKRFKHGDIYFFSGSGTGVLLRMRSSMYPDVKTSGVMIGSLSGT